MLTSVCAAPFPGIHAPIGDLKGDIENGVRTSVRNNAAAYGYSVMITASFGVLSAALGSPKAGDAFLYAAGAVAGVTMVEGAASRGFRVKLRGEPSEVVALGSSFSFASVGLAVGGATLCGELLSSWFAWLAGPLVASAIYVIASGVEMALAHAAQEHRDEGEADD